MLGSGIIFSSPEQCRKAKWKYLLMKGRGIYAFFHKVHIIPEAIAFLFYKTLFKPLIRIIDQVFPDNC